MHFVAGQRVVSLEVAVSYLQFMDWDLWSSTYEQDASDGDYYTEWLFDYSGYFRDEIEENALNEASCIQVLRNLITKADSEIEALEKDLSSLQNELALTELESWPEICCNALTGRINSLDDALSKLKDDRAVGAEMQQLLLSRKPAETLDEIVKGLLREHCGQETPDQHLDVSILNPIVDVTQNALYEDPNNNDSNIIKEEGRELFGKSNDSRSSELPSELHEKGSDDPEKIKELLVKSLVRSPDLGAINCAPVHSDEKKLSETLDKITENEDIRRSQVITTDKDQVLSSFSCKENGNISSEAKAQEEEKSTVEVKDVSSDDFEATGIKSLKKHLDSRLCTAQQQKIGNSDLDTRICDFTPKTARRAFKKESKLSPDEGFESTDSPLQVVYPQNCRDAGTNLYSFKGNKGNNSLQVMNIENTYLMHTDNSPLISLIGMQTESALYRLQLTDIEKPQAQDSKSEIAADLHKSNMSFHSKLKAAQGKQKLELEACAAREPHDSSVEVIPSTSIAVSKKRQRKSQTCANSANLNESKNRKTMKRALQPGQHETEGRAIVVYDSEFSELQRKIKLPANLEIQNSTVNFDMPNSDSVSIDNGNQIDLHISKVHSLADSLKKMNLTKLRTMAKEKNVNKYYKLTKVALVQQLAERLSSV